MAMVGHSHTMLLLISQTSHFSLPLFFFAVMPSNGGQTVECPRGMRAWLTSWLATKGPMISRWEGCLSMQGGFLAHSTNSTHPVLINYLIVGPNLFSLRIL